MNKVRLTLFSLATLTLLLTGCSYQHGSSTDFPYGWDSGFVWNHLYLTNDHSTAYCFDNPEFIKILDEAKRDQKKVNVSYSKYLTRGFLCSVDEKYEKVVVTNIELVNPSVKGDKQEGK